MYYCCQKGRIKCFVFYAYFSWKGFFLKGCFIVPIIYFGDSKKKEKSCKNCQRCHGFDVF